jgi:hypothetical protein
VAESRGRHAKTQVSAKLGIASGYIPGAHAVGGDSQAKEVLLRSATLSPLARAYFLAIGPGHTRLCRAASS